jgi:FkbM family methyltransferase
MELRRWTRILTGRGAAVRAEDAERARAALFQPWFDADGDGTLRLDYPLDADSLVLDLGGYQGQFASDRHGRFRCRVWVFEPVEDFAARIRGRFQSNPSIKVFGFGLADRDGAVELNLEGPSTTAFGGSGRNVSAPMKGVADFFAEQDLSEVDLLKMNIEGGEYDLLDAMLDRGLAAKVRYFQIQFHDHVPGAGKRAEAIRRRLEATHETQWSFPWVWESWRRIGARP